MCSPSDETHKLRRRFTNDSSSIDILGKDILDDMDRDGERSASQRSIQAETFNESEAEAGMSLNLDSSLCFIVNGDITYGVSDRINNERREISLELLARATREHRLAMRLLRESTTDIDVDHVRADDLELSAEPGTVHPLAGSLLSSLGELFMLKAESQASRGLELQRMWRGIGKQHEEEEIVAEHLDHPKDGRLAKVPPCHVGVEDRQPVIFRGAQPSRRRASRPTCRWRCLMR